MQGPLTLTSSQPLLPGVTCPCHPSNSETTGKERKCKKELSVSTTLSDDIVVRMIGWWLLQGFCAAHH